MPCGPFLILRQPFAGSPSPHLTDEQTEAQRGYARARGLTAGRWQGGHLDPGTQAPERRGLPLHLPPRGSGSGARPGGQNQERSEKHFLSFPKVSLALLAGALVTFVTRVLPVCVWCLFLRCHQLHEGGDPSLLFFDERPVPITVPGTWEVTGKYSLAGPSRARRAALGPSSWVSRAGR